MPELVRTVANELIEVATTEDMRDAIAQAKKEQTEASDRRGVNARFWIGSALTVGLLIGGGAFAWARASDARATATEKVVAKNTDSLHDLRETQGQQAARLQAVENALGDMSDAKKLLQGICSTLRCGVKVK